MKHKSDKAQNRVLRLHINYEKRYTKIINSILDMNQRKPLVGKYILKYFIVKQNVLSQKQSLYKENSDSYQNRIVITHQSYVKTIVRGKSKTEFGVKINVSLNYCYASIEHLYWDVYNEGGVLKMQKEWFRELDGYYKELLLLNKINLRRDNIGYLKELDKRHMDNLLFRNRIRSSKMAYQKRNARQEYTQSNQFEGKFGQGNYGYNLNHLRARLISSSMNWVAAVDFVMNHLRHTRGIADSCLNLILVI